MDFLPIPQKVEYGDGVFEISYKSFIVLQSKDDGCLLFAQMLQSCISQETGLYVPIKKGVAANGDIILEQVEHLDCDYTINIDKKKAKIKSQTAEGILHGVATLKQHIKKNGARLPALRVWDKPMLKHRGYYLDCSRGRVLKLDNLKRVVDLLCDYKINEFQLYVEHTYLFKNLSEAWRDDTPLTAEEILELDQYCKKRHIELIPSLSTFGHMYRILSTKTYEELCELSNSSSKPFSFVDAMAHHTINVSHKRAIEFSKSLILEYMSLFSSKKFNICCDETFDLASEKSKSLAEEKGRDNLYIDYVAELCSFLIEKGITPMFWGDIVYKQPETYQRLPKETICLNWGYLPNQNEDQIKILADVGATQYTCPGVCAWNRWIPLFKNSFLNIKAMTNHALKYNAIGILNTDWGDFGHINHVHFSVPGIIYGAALSWNNRVENFDEINKAISLLHYGDKTGEIVKDFIELSESEVFDWCNAVFWIEEKDQAKKEKYVENVSVEEAEKANKHIANSLSKLKSSIKNVSPEHRQILQYYEVNAEAAMIFNSIGVCIKQGADKEYKYELAEKLEKWFHSYSLLWRKEAKEGALPHICNIIMAYADYLRGRKIVG
jgi:hexosaminidase